MADLILVIIYCLAFVGAFIQAKEGDNEGVVSAICQALLWPVAIGAIATKFFNTPLPTKHKEQKQDG